MCIFLNLHLSLCIRCTCAPRDQGTKGCIMSTHCRETNATTRCSCFHMHNIPDMGYWKGHPSNRGELMRFTRYDSFVLWDPNWLSFVYIPMYGWFSPFSCFVKSILISDIPMISQWQYWNTNNSWERLWFTWFPGILYECVPYPNHQEFRLIHISFII